MKSRRRLAGLWLCKVLQLALPEQSQQWASAVRAEMNSIPDDGEALMFALDALRGIAVFHAVRALRRLVPVHKRNAFQNRLRMTPIPGRPSSDFKLLAVSLASAVGAVLLGLAYLHAAGAPARMPAVNTAALLLGLAAVAVQVRAPHGLPGWHGFPALLLACVLSVTALSGVSADGASRWIAIGPLPVQPSLIILPALILLFSRDQSPIGTAAMVLATISMATQPDKAMAGVLTLGLLVVAFSRPTRFTLFALGASVIAFAIASAHPDELAASPFVDQIFYTAFDVSLLAGLAVLAGAALLLVPAIYALIYRSTARGTCMVFGIVWLSIISAAVLGNYPTPVVGYGGSAILGYLLSLGILLRSADTRGVRDSSERSQPGFEPHDRHFLVVPPQNA